MTDCLMFSLGESGSTGAQSAGFEITAEQPIEDKMIPMKDLMVKFSHCDVEIPDDQHAVFEITEDMAI